MGEATTRNVYLMEKWEMRKNVLELPPNTPFSITIINKYWLKKWLYIIFVQVILDLMLTHTISASPHPPRPPQKKKKKKKKNK